MLPIQDIAERLMYVVVLLLSLTVHEYAHAWSAYRLGDDTASRMGRLTLNPIPHIDLFGTILLPLLKVPFGWAKPVPVNPARFKRSVTMRTGMMITAAAGPISNMILAVLCTVGYGLLRRYGHQSMIADSSGLAVESLLVQGIGVNVSLALFNLLPVPPLDGSRVADGLMPLRLRPAWESFTRLGPFLLLAVILFGGSLLSGPSHVAFGWLNALLQLIVSA
jgi:Zn-dependent protease